MIPTDNRSAMWNARPKLGCTEREIHLLYSRPYTLWGRRKSKDTDLRYRKEAKGLNRQIRGFRLEKATELIKKGKGISLDRELSFLVKKT